MWKLNNMLLNNQWITEEIKEEIKKYLAANDNEYMTKEARLYNGGRTACSISGAGKTGQPHGKE